MNQIIYNNHIDRDVDNDYEIDSKISKYSFWHLNKFKFQFYICSFISVFMIIYYVYFRYDLGYKEKVSDSVLESFELTKIYQNSSEYTTKNMKDEKVFFYEDNSFSVIGAIYIKELGISYPILSDISNDFLKISPCRFYGPMPNEVRKSLYCCT